MPGRIAWYLMPCQLEVHHGLTFLVTEDNWLVPDGGEIA